MKRKYILIRYVIRVPLSLICLFFFNGIAFSQAVIQVTGQVTDAKGEPLSGVNILVKGTTDGTATDNSGSYSIRAKSNSTLVFSYIGSESTERAVSGQSVINVQLQAADKSLNDVVVIGYGTQKKVNLIGSVATISSRQITQSPVSTLSNALSGRLPGAVIQQSNGEPGKDAATITIRGMATLGNNQPLVVIDGIPDRDMNSLNPNDVESISVLKHASAAIYGARAANGVILVTTKQGKEGTPMLVNYGFYQGFMSPTSLPKMADAANYSSMIREMQTYAGVDEANMTFSKDDIEKYKSGQYPWTHPNTDWIKSSFNKFTPSREHNVSVSGGSKTVDYFVSFGTHHDDGIFKNSATSFDRFNLKATVNAKINEYLTLGLDINGSQENRNYPATSTSFNLEGAIKSLPTSPAYYPNGLPGPDIAYGQNPAVSVTNQTGFDDSKRYRANNIFRASLKIPGVKGLVLSSYYAYDVNLGQEKFFEKPWTLYSLDVPSYLAAGNTGTEDGSAFLVGSLKGVTDPALRDIYDDANTKTFNIKLDYNTTINGVHNISAFVAYESSESEGKGINAFRRYFVSDLLPYLFAGGDAEKDNGETVFIDSRVNYFGRLSYNYKEKYLFQFSLRRDGSLRFSEQSGRWGNFPSVLAGWRVSNEKFWKDHVRVIDFLKLKASWGQMGNDLVDPFQYLTVYSPGTGYVLGTGRTYATGLSQQVATNPNITWEVANVYNAGFESSLLNSRVTLNADFFYQKRNRILVHRNASVPQFTGLLLPDENFGIVENRGFEVELGYNNRFNDLTFSINGNLAFARNKVIEFDEPAKSVPWQRLTGKPQGSTLVYHAIGIFKDQAEIDKTTHVDGAIPGDIIIQDYNNDGVINTDDQILNTKTVNPEITYGVSFSLGYKNWALSGLVQGAGSSSRPVLVPLQGLAGNYFAYDAIGRWTPENTDASKPRAFDRTDPYWRGSYLTDYSYQNCAYARMKNLVLSYTIPSRILKTVLLKSAQIYVSGENLFLIYNKNKILDPELGGIVTKISDAPYPGAYDHTGVYNYPIMRSYTIGARISL